VNPLKIKGLEEMGKEIFLKELPILFTFFTKSGGSLKRFPF